MTRSRNHSPTAGLLTHAQTPHVHDCVHCGTALAPREDRFCCAGCSLAWDLIHGSGLGDYYKRREALPPRPDPVAEEWAHVTPDSKPDGTARISCSISGLRCASCVWVTERVLEQTPGITSAHVSYATGRATIEWDPSLIDLTSVAARIATLGYQARPSGEGLALDRDLLARLGVAVFCAVNVMLASVTLYIGWLGPMDESFQALFRWVSLVLATPVVLWSAAPFFKTALLGLQNRIVHMDVPIALGVGGIYIHGIWGTLVGQDTYLDSGTMLVALLLLGRVLEVRGRQSAARAASSLAARLPTVVRRISGGSLVNVTPDALHEGDVIEVAMGEEIGADGTVVSGSGEARMAIVTGEFDLVHLQTGDRVVAGAVLETGSLQVNVERAGKDTLVQQMADALTNSLDRSGEDIPDPIAPLFTLLTLLASALAALYWTWYSGGAHGLKVSVAVLVVACPCALALARPLSGASGLGAAARRGLLMRSAADLMALSEVDVVALDKTGTITLGQPKVTEATDEALRICAALERSSIHPLARAIVTAAVERGIPLDRATEITEVPGRGISGMLDGVRWTLRAGPNRGLLLTGDDGRSHQLTLSDAVRDDAETSLDGLRARGLEVVMLTGDRAPAAEDVAGPLHIGEVLSGLAPFEKVSWIESKQAQGHRVLFLGDGLNDGPSMKEAAVGIAMEGGAGSTILAGQGIVAGGRLASVLAGLDAAHAVTIAIRHSRRRAILYNVLAVSAATVGWVNPLVAAILMPLSSLMVIVEASRVEGRVATSSYNARGGIANNVTYQANNPTSQLEGAR